MLSLLLALLPAPFIQATEASTPGQTIAAKRVAGTWHVALETPMPDGVRDLEFALWPSDDGFRGGLRRGDDHALLNGRLDASGGQVLVDVAMDGVTGTLRLVPNGNGFVGELDTSFEYASPVRVEPITANADDFRFEVDISGEHPVRVDREGLPDFLEEAFQPIIDDFIQNDRVVGLSLAFILDFEVVDIRSFGWQDFVRDVPASADTLYRWASISKPVTAVAALQLAERGKLDLERDVREYVPEFPEKRWPVTAHQLLCHQGSIVHYQHGPIQTERDYDDPNPFRSRILALDMFKESPLLSEPGTAYSYSTHGYALLGAVVERAGEKRFAEQVHERIAKRMGMTTMQPDFHQSVDIPNQTKGYAVLGDGRTMDCGDSNVAWKLAGGGFISNVEDLALFGLGLLENRLLTESSREAMFTSQKTAAGADTGYGLGVSVQERNGLTTVGHGGSQRKTRTYLLVVPELGLGVAAMCNTEGTNIQGLAQGLMDALLE